MATGRLPDPNTAPVTAKGDLYTYSTVPAKLAVGNNGDTLVADSSTSTGLRWQEPKAGNPVLNSAMQIWQRGTSIAGAGGLAYTADRWQSYNDTPTTISRQVTGDTTNLPNIQYCARNARNSGSTSTSTIWFAQTFESANSIPFAGKVVTFSFYARRGANFSASSNNLTYSVVTGTGTDQNAISGFTGGADTITGTSTLTTTWQRFTYTGTIPAATTQIGIVFKYTPTGTAGAADYFEVTGVQLEVGSVATPFKTYAATLAGELLAAQRYYWRTTNTGYGHYGLGYAELATQLNINFKYPVTMRTTPSINSSGAGNLAAYRQGAFVANTSVMTFNQGNADQMLAYCTTAAGSLTQFSPYVLFSNNVSSFVEFSAEL